MNSIRQSAPKCRQRLTRLGFHFLFVGSFAMLGGALRGFNLLLVLAGLLVGTLLMQWRWSRRSIETMEVQRRLPNEMFAGRSFRVRHRLTNHSRFMPAWMIRVEDRIESLDQSQAAKAIGAAGLISAGKTVVSTCDCVIHRRGRYRFGPMQWLTSFPFALICAQKTAEEYVEFHVYPRLYTLQSRWRHQLRSRTGGVATTARSSGQVEGDFFGLREWRSGDSPKWIHWRTSARINALAVRQYEQQRRFDTCVLVDAQYSAKHDSGEHDRDMAEAAISLAGTFLVQLVGSPTNKVVLAVAGQTSDACIGGGSDAGMRRMLMILAEITPGPSPPLGQAAKQAMRMVGRPQDLLVVSPRSMAAAQQSDPDFFVTILPWLRRGSVQWIDVASELNRWVVDDHAARSRPRENINYRGDFDAIDRF